MVLYLGSTRISVTNRSSRNSKTALIRSVLATGVYGAPSSSFTFIFPRNASDIGDYAMDHAFQGCLGLTSVDL